MTTLVVLAYADEYRAAEVLAALRRVLSGVFAELVDAVSIARRTDWTVSLTRDVELSVARDCCVQFWRGLIASLILVPGLASLRRNVDAYGIDPEFERRLAGGLPPGSSAVMFVVPPATLDLLNAALDCFSGTLFETPIERCCTHA